MPAYTVYMTTVIPPPPLLTSQLPEQQLRVRLNM